MAWLSILTITAPAGRMAAILGFWGRRWRGISLNGRTNYNIEQVLRLV